MVVLSLRPRMIGEANHPKPCKPSLAADSARPGVFANRGPDVEEHRLLAKRLSVGRSAWVFT